MRRLITLISAGRNRIVVIRRELPRTEDAGWVRTPYRTKDTEGSPFREPRPVSDAVAEKLVINELPLCQSEPGIPSFKHSSLRRRRFLSRPRCARRRAALTGGGGAVRRPWRECQAFCEPGKRLCSAWFFSASRLNP